MKYKLLFFLSLLFFLAAGAHALTLTDSRGLQHNLPDHITRVICSGPGCLRLLTYLQAADKAVAVDDIESRRNPFDARPYALANPSFKALPVFGEFRGKDNPERILSLDPAPQVIFKTFAGSMGYDPDELQSKTGIPVISLEYGNLGQKRPVFYRSLRIMGKALGKEARAEELISFFESRIAELVNQTSDIPETQQPSIYIGGIAYKGAHGFVSTEPTYPPFVFVHARNVAFSGRDIDHADIAKETLLALDPNILLVDLATLQLGDHSSGLFELRTDDIYQTLSAVRRGKVYGVLPYNWYTKNYGSILANAFFIGKLLYPERFADLDPTEKADEIYSFLVGKPVFAKMNALFGNLAYQQLDVQQ